MSRNEAVTGPLGEVRRTRETSHDPKVAKTRAAIVAAVEDLVREGHTGITVSDIVRRAGTSRSGFYTHFASLDELSTSILLDAFATIGSDDLELRRTAAVTSAEASRIGLRRMVEHMLEHRGLYLGAFGLPQSSRAYETAVDEFALRLRQTIAVLSDVPAGIDPDDSARFIASGALALVIGWMRQDTVPPTAEMVQRLVALMPAWLVVPGTD